MQCGHQQSPWNWLYLDKKMHRSYCNDPCLATTTAAAYFALLVTSVFDARKIKELRDGY
jgi:hypothetical protein